MKEPLVLKLIVITDTLFIISFICVSTFLFFQWKNEQDKPSQDTEDVLMATSEQNYEQLLQEPQEKEFSVSVCHKADCVLLLSDNQIKDGIVDKDILYKQVSDFVIPYFETRYGGKTIASNQRGNFIYWREDNIPDLTNIYEDVYEAFESQTNTVIEIEIKDLPGTSGTYAKKYIEVDNSKQKLYVWIDGKVEKEILLSAAKKGYEVYGIFPIIDKGIAPIAPGGKYMPYWLAFYYSKRQDSWYGLHALIWWYDENGNKVYESTGNIGLRKSGGCIRMLLEDAKYLYGIFEKGDLILIHE